MFVKDKKQNIKINDFSLKNKILLTLAILFFVQICANIPAPGINRDILADFLNSDTSNAFSIFTMFSGNAFSKMSIFVIGISPYISASIVMQLLRAVIPYLEEMAKDGKTGQDRFKKITYIVAGILSVIQTIPVTMGFASYGLLIENNVFYISLVSVSLIVGSIIEIFLGNVIDKKGVGNGISLILLINILSRFPSDIRIIFDMFIRGKGFKGFALTVIMCGIIITITLIGIIYLQDGEKRIKTQYSSQVKGQKGLYGVANNFIPMKVNMAGVMPIIFTSSMLQMYILIITLFKVDANSFWQKIASFLSSNNWFQLERPIYNLGFLIYCGFIFAFSYFYSTLVFDPEEISENLRKQGAVIVGIRPGKPTEEYLNNKLKILRNVGSICLITVTTIPMI